MSLTARCASHPAPIPASQPASLPDEYMLIERGQEAPGDGFFLSINGSVHELSKRADENLAWRLQLDDAKQDAADNKADLDAAMRKVSHEDWCVRWCLEIGLLVGAVLGGFGGGLIGEKLAHSR